MPVIPAREIPAGPVTCTKAVGCALIPDHGALVHRDKGGRLVLPAPAVTR